MTSCVDKLRQITVIQRHPLPGRTSEKRPRQPSSLTMKSTYYDNKKSQSSRRLFSSSAGAGRRDNLVNPYNQDGFARMCLKWLQSDTVDNSESGLVRGLPEFECGVFPNSRTDACSCCPREPSGRDHAGQETRPSGCCREDRERKAAYWKIKERVENAVEVISVPLPRD